MLVAVYGAIGIWIAIQLAQVMQESDRTTDWSNTPFWRRLAWFGLKLVFLAITLVAWPPILLWWKLF
jgi:hypothetical protein